MAFGSTLAREEAFTDDVWHERASGGASGVDRVTFVAERDGRWIGLTTGLAADPDEPDNVEPLLVGMFVEPPERGHGVGVALVAAVVAWARARGATSLYLWVTATNDSAIALYDKCGFLPTGEQKPLEHSPSLAEVRMVRDLR
jgi:GNAT superfamily N-acetyltransferase